MEDDIRHLFYPTECLGVLGLYHTKICSNDYNVVCDLFDL